MKHPFFSKREPQIFNARSQAAPSTSPATMPATAVAAQDAANKPAAAAPAEPESSHRVPSTGKGHAHTGGGSTLTVGPKIKLKGVEITDCDTLVVEGTVEASMHARLMHIASSGAYQGAAEVEVAEVHGCFTGTLTVREKLVIHSTGQVSGTIRYGKLVVQEGGQIGGEMHSCTPLSHPAPSSVAKGASAVGMD